MREPDYLKFLAEAEKEAVDPDQYLDRNCEDECGRDQEVCAAPEFSDAVAAGSSGNATCNSVIRFVAARVQMSSSGRNPTLKIR